MRPRIILGIETSCDETAAALLVDGKIISDRTTRQTMHEQYGGVVPELASRAHERLLAPAIDGVLADAGMKITDIEAVAVTYGPGLAGALLVGVALAKGLAAALNIPVYAVNHIEGHIWAVEMSLMGNRADESGCQLRRVDSPDALVEWLPMPFLGLIVSGGHTILLRVEGFRCYVKLCSTRDDAAGELFDKVGRMLGLAFPAGADIDRLALNFKDKPFYFPRARFTDQQPAFSFSGLKTAVSHYLKNHPELFDVEGNASDAARRMICRGVMESVADMLVWQVGHFLAGGDYRALVIGGGVSASQFLRRHWERLAADYRIPLFIPPPQHCTDNGAMVAYTGWKMALAGIPPAIDSLAVEPALSLFKSLV